jgi:hypothetical protein
MSNTPFSKEGPYTGLGVLQPVPRSTEVSRTLVLFLAATVACALAIPAAAQGAGRYVEVEYPVWSKYPNALKDHVFYDGH